MALSHTEIPPLTSLSANHMLCRALALCTSSHLIITHSLASVLIIIPILLISKMRQREVQRLAQGHRVSEW